MSFSEFRRKLDNGGDRGKWNAGGPWGTHRMVHEITIRNVHPLGVYAIRPMANGSVARPGLTEEAYREYFDSFDPVDFDPREWARLAKKAGMKYAVFTAKHHDGFCLFDSALTDYKSTTTKVGRDFVAEYVEAFRAEGLAVDSITRD